MKTIIIFSFFVFLISCTNNSLQSEVIVGNAFGTTYTIKYYFNNEIDLEKGIDSVIHAVNKSVSTYQSNSDISKINRGDSNIIVDQIFIDNFKISKEVYNNSDGYFDPTIGVLRNAYGFGDVKPLQKIDKLILDSLLQYVGFYKVNLTSENKIKKDFPQIYLDFNAVAKGYGIDCIGSFLESKEIKNYLIELGGEILAKGKNIEKDEFWVVGIEAVDSKVENRSYTAVVSLHDHGMATSGNYRKFRIDPISGKKYVHTINPLTGSAEKSDVTSATVIASTCAVADAYATTFMALGIEKSKILLGNLNEIEAYLTYNNGNNSQQIFMTEGFKILISN